VSDEIIVTYRLGTLSLSRLAVGVGIYFSVHVVPEADNIERCHA